MQEQNYFIKQMEIYVHPCKARDTARLTFIDTEDNVNEDNLIILRVLNCHNVPNKPNHWVDVDAPVNDEYLK